MISDNKVYRILERLGWAAVVLAISACGGGGGGGGDGGGGDGGGTPRSGILADSPVQGVAYTTTPSRLTGTTDSNGAYAFVNGDTVAFSLGGLQLGSVQATGIVTPTELAAGNSNKLSNLLVVLQSLDADGNPGNGIVIPAAAAAAVTSAIDLTVAPASLNTAALQAAMNAGEISSPIVSQTDADAHYLSQGLTFLSSSIWVIRPSTTNGDTTALLRFAANGQYLIGETGTASMSGMAGVEYGTVTLDSFDVYGYKIPTPTITVDTNGDWGLSYSLNCDRWRSVGDQLIFTEDFTTPLTCANSTTDEAADKASNNPTGIVGVWALGSATIINTLHVVFFPDGKLLVVDPIGDVDQPSCGGPGVEGGSYTYNATTGVLSVSNATYDTNGCVGFFNNSVGETMLIVIAPDGNSFTVDGADILYRVSN